MEKSGVVVEEIRGLFEIHITVDCEGKEGRYAFARLWHFCEMKNGASQGKTEGKMKPIFACAHEGVCPNQLMTSRFETGNMETAVASAQNLAAEMREAGLLILRVKVEAMATNTGVPQSTASLKEWVQRQGPKLTGKPYFEFHVKTSSYASSPNPSSAPNSGQSLAAFCEELRRGLPSQVCAAFSMNLCGKSKKPLFTLRVYSFGKAEAYALKDSTCLALATRGFLVDTDVQCEFSIHDTNEHLDEGWLRRPPPRSHL